MPQRHNFTIRKRSFRYNKEEWSSGGLADPSGVLIGNAWEEGRGTGEEEDLL